jgi:hypothetical protein
MNSSSLQNHITKLILFAMIFIFFSCSASSKKNAVPLMELGSEDLINYEKKQAINQPVEIRNSRNDNRPEWTSRPVYEQGNAMYYVGAFMRGSDYSVSLRAANAEALKSLVQDIGLSIRTEFSMYAKGSNIIDSGIDRYIVDGIATLSHNTHLQGARMSESYYEELIDPLSSGRPFYNVWVKLEITKSDYTQAKAYALRRLKDDFHTAGQVEAKQKAQLLLDELKESAQ